MKIKLFSQHLVLLLITFVLFIFFIGISDTEMLGKTQSSITIERPRLHEILLGTTDYTIIWTQKELGNQPVRITLINAQNNSAVLTIKDSHPNTGSCKWHVPVSLKTGGYRIHIKVLGKNVSSTSKVFTIRNPDFQQSKPTLKLPNRTAEPQVPKKVDVPTIDPTLGNNHDLQISSFYLHNNKLMVNLRNNGESFFTGPVGFYIKLLATSGRAPENSKTMNINLGPRSHKEFILLEERENFLRSLWQWTCSFNVEIAVDYQELIPETNESNNTKRQTLYSDKLFIEGNSITAGGRRNQNVGNGMQAIITLHQDVYEERTPDKKYFKIKISYKVKNCARERMLSFTIEQWWSLQLPGGTEAGLMGPEEANTKDLIIHPDTSQDVIMESKLPQSPHSNEYKMWLMVKNNQTNERYKLFECNFTLRIVDGI